MKTIIRTVGAAAFLDGDRFEEGLARVTEERRRKVLSYRFPKDRALSLAAGLLLGEMLREWGVSGEARMMYGEHGKPYLAEHPGVYFNLSHSGQTVLCAVSDVPCGCDTEQIGRGDLSLAKRFFAPFESEKIAACPDGVQRAVLFTRYWTLKESYIKCLGTGLSEDLRSFTVHPENRPVTAEAEGIAVPYSFFEYDLGDGYCRALCLEGAGLEKPRLYVRDDLSVGE